MYDCVLLAIIHQIQMQIILKFVKMTYLYQFATEYIYTPFFVQLKDCNASSLNKNYVISSYFFKRIQTRKMTLYQQDQRYLFILTGKFHLNHLVVSSSSLPVHVSVCIIIFYGN